MNRGQFFMDTATPSRWDTVAIEEYERIRDNDPFLQFLEGHCILTSHYIRICPGASGLWCQDCPTTLPKPGKGTRQKVAVGQGWSASPTTGRLRSRFVLWQREGALAGFSKTELAGAP